MFRSGLGKGFALPPFFLADGAAQAAAMRHRSVTSEAKSEIRNSKSETGDSASDFEFGISDLFVRWVSKTPPTLQLEISLSR